MLVKKNHQIVAEDLVINFIEGNGISFSVTHDPQLDQANVSASSSGSLSQLRVFNVEASPYNAVPDSYYTDGVATASSTTLTSASAAFTQSDVGKTIVLLNQGTFGSFAPLHTTIASVTNATTVVLATTAARTATTRFYISRGGVQTAAIQAAIDACELAGGGKVLCPGVGYLHAGLVLKNRVTLCGSGHGATLLHLVAGANNHSLQNHVSTNGTTDPNTELTGVRDLILDGNKANQTGTSHGIFYDMNQAWTQTATDETFDANHRIQNVRVYNHHDNGIYSTNSRASNFITQVEMFANDGYGIYLAADSLVTNCNIGWSGLAGIKVLSNAYLTNVYSFFSGRVTPTVGYGFDLANCTGAVMEACRAQDNQDAGFNFNATQACRLVGCHADTNSVRSAGAVPGFDFWNSTNNALIGCLSYDRKAVTTQKNALRLRSNSVNNHIECQHVTITGGGTAGGVFLSLPSDSYQNEIHINADHGFSNQAATAAADPFLVEYIRPPVLAAPTTIPAPAPAAGTIIYPGCRLTYILQQDGTGGRTITWNAVFLNTPTTNTAVNGYTVGRFTYDGTNWIGS